MGVLARGYNRVVGRHDGRGLLKGGGQGVFGLTRGCMEWGGRDGYDATGREGGDDGVRLWLVKGSDRL